MQYLKSHKFVINRNFKLDSFDTPKYQPTISGFRYTGHMRLKNPIRCAKRRHNVFKCETILHSQVFIYFPMLSFIQWCTILTMKKVHKIMSVVLLNMQFTFGFKLLGSRYVNNAY